jgi:hypothetical protein
VYEAACYATPPQQKSVPDLTPERDQLNQDQSHVYDLVLAIFLKDGASSKSPPGGGDFMF